MPEYIKDYNDLYDDYEDEQYRELTKRPKCDCCGEHIQDEQFCRIFDYYICRECIDDHLVDTEGYIDD